MQIRIKIENTNQAYRICTYIIRLIIPLLAMVFLNGLTFATIYKTRRFLRKRHPCHGTTSLMILIWIVLIFLILISFRMAFWFLFHLCPQNRGNWFWITPVAHLASITNSSVNFIIYCLVGRSFRAKLIIFFSYNGGKEKDNTKNAEIDLKTNQQDKLWLSSVQL